MMVADDLSVHVSRRSLSRFSYALHSLQDLVLDRRGLQVARNPDEESKRVTWRAVNVRSIMGHTHHTMRHTESDPRG
jgi:hypothetical protein